MRYVNWWFVGGAVVTIIVSVLLSDVWSLSGLGSAAIGWGMVIGSDIREARLREKRGGSPRTGPRWIDPAVTVSITAMLIAVGIFVTVAIDWVAGRKGDFGAPVLAATVLLVLAAAVLLPLLIRWRRVKKAGRG